MTISLPYLWIAGHLAAPIGALLVVFHCFTSQRIVTRLCVFGGVLSCAFLLFVMTAINQSFFGIYTVLAWALAFLSGYLMAAPFAYAFWFFRSTRVGKGSGTPPA